MGTVEGCHKIGRSRDAENRLRQIDIFPVKLQLLCTIPSRRAAWLERYLHVAFKHRRVRGEWFRLGEEEVGLIRAIPVADCLADLPAAIIALHAPNYKKTKNDRPDVCRVELWMPPALLAAIDAAAGKRKRASWCLRALAAAAGVEVVMPPPPGRPKKVTPAAEPKVTKRRGDK